MALIAGMLGRSYTHTLRFGAARDISYLPTTTEGYGFATDVARQSLNYTYMSTTQ